MRIFRVGNFGMGILHGVKISPRGSLGVGSFRAVIYVTEDITVRKFRVRIFRVGIFRERIFRVSIFFCHHTEDIRERWREREI